MLIARSPVQLGVVRVFIGQRPKSENPARSLLSVVCGAPFVVAGVILFMNAVARIWMVLIFRYGAHWQPCDFVGTLIVFGAWVVLGLSLTWLGSLIYQVIATHRIFSNAMWVCVTVLLFLSLITPLAYRLLFGTGCSV
jgi:hypothetical protein